MVINEESLPPVAVVLGNGAVAASEQVGGVPLTIRPLVYNVAREGALEATEAGTSIGHPETT